MARVRKPVRPIAQQGASSEVKTIAVIAAVVVAVGAYAYFKTGKPEGGAAAGGAAATAAGLAPYALEIPAKGDADAPVVLAKFTDMECPFCGKFAPTLDELVAADPKAVRLEYHHYPLSFHQNAEPGACAVMAAHKQGKFFEMLDKVYGNQKKLDRASLESYAKEIGLDVAKWNADMADPEVLRYVRMELKAGEKIGVSGTPTLFVNGKKVDEREKDKLDAAIKAEAAEVQKLVVGGKTVVEARRMRMGQNGGDNYLTYVLDRKPFDVDTAPAKPPPPPKPEAPDLTVYNAQIFPFDAIRGPVDAPVTIIECTDFQCPFCSRGNATMTEVEKAYPNDVRVVLHNRPLDFHPFAVPAAKAVMAAGLQGKFWELQDKLFENQKALEDANIIKYASEIPGLDLEKWKADWASPAIAEQVKKHDTACQKNGVSGTPGFFVNGRKLDGAKPFEEFKTVIDEQLKLAKAELAKGIAPKDLYAHILKLGRRTKGSAMEGAMQTIDIAGAPADGPSSAVATLVIFSDFECPFCSRIGGPVHDAKKILGDQLRVVFKQFPLNFHKSAMPAAQASLAAARQGKFWQMHDRLFANQKKLGDADLKVWAQVEGLDMARFEADRNDPAIKAQIEKDMAEASRIGVQGTPTLFLNGRRLKSPPSSGDVLADIIRTEILGQE